MKNLIIGLLLMHLTCIAVAAEGDYAVSKIAPALLLNANAVKRLETVRFEVINLEHARHYTRVAYTILNEKGDKFAQCLEWYDKLHTVESIEGRLFDENGKKIRSLKRTDISDRSGTSDNTLADDSRYKYHNFYNKVYPYTVEYEVEIRYNNTMFYPGWIPVEDEHLSVESGSVTVSLASGIDFRYRDFNFKEQPAIVKGKDATAYTWQLKNLPAVTEEFASPNWYEITPVVCMAPSQFAIQGYKGNMTTWNDYGKFVYALKAGRDQLPENIRLTVHELTDKLKTPKEKVEALYTFLQQNSRYISVQLGIGGWQPFDASYVATKRYGDCKALVNYMFSLLKEAGIRSNYTLVKSGESNPYFISDFPSSQFNHVILSVPLASDTLWLECTDQTLPAGYLSGFTSNRSALVINEEGGFLVRTPHYNLRDNLQERVIRAQIDESGTLNAEIKTLYKGRQEDNVHSLIHNLGKDKVLDYLKHEISLPTYDITKFNYTEERSSMPSINEQLSLTATDYAQVSGKRMFLTPNLLSRDVSKVSPNETRKFDINLKYEYTDRDSIEIKIPTGYAPEAMPAATTVTSPFGSYRNSFSVEKDKIIYFRSMEQYSGRFPVGDYGKMVDFYNQVYKADRARIVLVRQD